MGEGSGGWCMRREGEDERRGRLSGRGLKYGVGEMGEAGDDGSMKGGEWCESGGEGDGGSSWGDSGGSGACWKCC